MLDLKNSSNSTSSLWFKLLNSCSFFEIWFSKKSTKSLNVFSFKYTIFYSTFSDSSAIRFIISSFSCSRITKLSFIAGSCISSVNVILSCCFLRRNNTIAYQDLNLLETNIVLLKVEANHSSFCYLNDDIVGHIWMGLNVLHLHLRMNK